MLKRCIQAENRKLHASPIWGLFFALPFISAIYGTFNYLQNLEILKDGWYSLWTQHCFIRCFSFLQWWLLMQLIYGDWNILDTTGILLWQVRSGR